MKVSQGPVQSLTSRAQAGRRASSSHRQTATSAGCFTSPAPASASTPAPPARLSGAPQLLCLLLGFERARGGAARPGSCGRGLDKGLEVRRQPLARPPLLGYTDLIPAAGALGQGPRGHSWPISSTAIHWEPI
jgi:hypothetical protein